MAPIIPLFVGTAATAGGAAATSGLIGTAGAVTAGGLLTAGGVGLSAMGQLQQGRVAAAEGESAQNIANYNAAVQEREAKALKAKGQFEQVRQAKRGERVMSSLQAALGGAGALGAGTPLLLEAEQAAELELENLLIGYEAEVGAQRALSQAELDKLSGKVAKQRGKTAKQASYLKAGSTLLTGFEGAFV